MNKEVTENNVFYWVKAYYKGNENFQRGYYLDIKHHINDEETKHILLNPVKRKSHSAKSKASDIMHDELRRIKAQGI